MRNLITIAFLIISVIAVGQTNEKSQLERVEQMKINLKISEEARKERVDNYLKAHTEAKRLVNLGDRGVALLYDVIDGYPQYLTPDNNVAAETIGVPEFRSGGGLGLNLTGKGMKVGVWDGGYARTSHVEYDGRILTSDGNEFGVSNHASHVMGTVLATGVDPSARGMAPDAIGLSYGFSNDISEMTAVATTATGNLIISNHSYGIPGGWRDGAWLGNTTLSTIEDASFGFYDDRARQWDELAFNAPYYTMVKSAGNDRGDSGDGSFPPDGPYDIINSNGVSKNIITVGAVQRINGGYSGVESVVMSSFSGWGPTDDGRIKPDIVGAGVSLRSAFSGGDESYGNLSGTSMSAPNVTGALLLLQELHRNLNGGNFMKSATLKSLIFQTANEAGTVGPDYIHGWGLLNAEAAARLLLDQNDVNTVVRELVLNNGETYELSIDPAPGTEVKATIVWTDVPGTPVARALDPEDLMLVNDLDMRINSTSEEHKPWILDPAVPGAAATTGDNFRDNAEQVIMTSEDGEPVTLTIGHKGALSSGSQSYSLVLTYTPDNPNKKYYWVGAAGGDWNNGANWSETSGGAAANAIPDSSTDVVFDENSFDTDGEITVLVPSNSDINSLKWFASENAALNLQNFEMTVTGDLIFSSENTSLMAGTFVLKDGASTTARVAANGVDLSDVNFQIQSENTKWIMTGDFTVNTIDLFTGTLEADNTNFIVSNLTNKGDGVATLSLNGATVNVMSSFNLESTNLTFNDSETKFILSGDNTQWTTSGLNISAEVEVTGVATINGTGNTFSSLKVLDGASLQLAEDVVAETVNLEPGATMLFDNEKTIEITGDFLSTGTAEKMVNLTGVEENPGVITINGHRRVCSDFMNINKVAISGSASVTAGENSTLTDADSWSIVSCENVLFSDFDFQFGCTNGLTQFSDLSSGAISGWNWNLGSGVTSTVQNPEVVYTSTGVFDITLDVTDGNDTKSYTRQLEIIENTLTAGNSIIDNNGTLASREAAATYQWYRNNEPINGATNRTYNTQGEGGTYFVLSFDATCNLKSEELELVITSIEEEVIKQIEREVKIAPNPSEDFVDITMTNDFYGEIQIIMIDLNGRVSYASKVEKQQREFSERIRVDERPTGLYIVQMVFENSFVVNKKVLIK